MVAKQFEFSERARRRMLHGIEVLATAVAVTLGPKGRNVVLETDYGAPRVTKDGVTVAKELELGDKFANMGIQMVREVASRASYQAGDGTTTATVLAYAIVQEGAKKIAAGLNPMDLKRGIDAAVRAVVADLHKHAKPVTSSEEIAQVATISANGDREIGHFVAEAMRQVGKNGIVTVEPATSMKTELEVVEGMHFDRGYISPTFVTDQKRMRIELDEPYILVHEGKLAGMRELLPLLEAVMETERPLFIVAEAIEGEAFATLAVNKLRGSLKVGAVKSPGYGALGKALLQDIAILTGGHAICEELGIKLENAGLQLLGRARRVSVDKGNTTIVGGRGDKAEVDARIRELAAQIGPETSDYDREKLQERIARLSGGAAVIKVGGGGDAEVKERKDRVDNALNATRAAIEEGLLPGGGVALLRSAAALATLDVANADQRHGVDLVRRALAYPARQIVDNAGAEGALVARKILDTDLYAYGYDAERGDYADLVSRGIVDPTKVVRTSLQAAASIAGLLLTTEAMVAELHDRVKLEGHHHHETMDMDF